MNISSNSRLIHHLFFPLLVFFGLETKVLKHSCHMFTLTHKIAA